MAEGQGYRFEPLERRGLLLGLNGGQVAVVAVAVIVALGLVKARPGPRRLRRCHRPPSALA